MLEILTGLGAAVAWGTANVFMAKAVRAEGAAAFAPAFQWAQALLLAPFAAVATATQPFAADALLLPVAAGGLAAIGTLVFAQALRLGVVGIVASLAGLEGLVAALIAIATGEPASALVWTGLALALAGTCVAARSGPAGMGPPAGMAFALMSAATYGTALWALASASVSPFVAICVMRIVGGAGALAISRTLWRGPLRPLFAVAALDVSGLVLFTVSARIGTTTLGAVLATQFGTVAAIVAYFLLRERLSGRQIVGIVLLAAGAAAVAATRI